MLLRMTDNEGFDIFYLRDDNIKKEENDAREHDVKKGEKKPENDIVTEKCRRTVEIIKFVLLVMILITSTVAMIFSIRIYYTQSNTQNLVFPQSVMDKTDTSLGDIVIDTADDIDIGELFTTQVYVDLSPDVVQQPNNTVNNKNSNKKPSASTTKVNETTTVKTEVVQTTAPATTEKSNELVNINLASFDELMTLEGIGETKAKAIINYRIENGAFLSVDELLEVDGIGEKTLEKLRPYITVDY